MSSNAIAAGGTKLKIKYVEEGSGAVSGYSNIAEIVDITGPSLSADTEDVSSHDSFIDEGSWEDHLATILRSGEVTFDINYMPGNESHNTSSGNTTPGAGQSPGLLYLFENREKSSFQIEFPDDLNTQWDFNAYVTGFEPSAPHDGALDASVTLKITDQPSLN